MNQKIATIFGGSGFIGRHLIRKLTLKGYRLIIATRSPYLNGFLKSFGDIGQIELVKINIYNLSSLEFSDTLTSLLSEISSIFSISPSCDISASLIASSISSSFNTSVSCIKSC